MNVQTIKWVGGAVRIIDQTKLPGKFKYIYCRDIKTLWHAIRRLSVRGAPALGVAAGFGVHLESAKFKGKDTKKYINHMQKTCDYIATSRPTAVNLFNVLDQMRQILKGGQSLTVSQLQVRVKKEAFEVYQQDRDVCRIMGDYGAKLIKKGHHVLTVCNAGALATVDYGTALGVMYSAKKKKKKFKVYSCETRPLLQGARLTTWELLRNKIDTTLICDNMAASLMKKGEIDVIFTGADRIASNGDTANKIGTYNLAVLAQYHKIPFYIVAPRSTFDMKIKTGKQIPVEQRDKKEVTGFGESKTAPSHVKVYNPAFDVTDNKLITGIITEYGIIAPPYKTNIKKAFLKAR